jgi:hypothetical protein
MCPLPARRQITAMADASVRPYLNQPLDIERGVLAQVTLSDNAQSANCVAYRYNLVARKLTGLLPRIDTRMLKDFESAGPADAEYVGQGNFAPLIVRYVNADNAHCYSFSPAAAYAAG